VFINHDTRMVSLQRPRQEQQPDTIVRTFLPRLHSVEEEEVSLYLCDINFCCNVIVQDEDGWLVVVSY